MDKANSAEAAKTEFPTEAAINQLSRNLYGIGSIAFALKHLANNFTGGEDNEASIAVSMKALAEKAGYLSDSCLYLLGKQGGVAGNYDEWADVAIPQATEANHV